MPRIFAWVGIVLAFSLPPATRGAEPTLSRIAFGSCARQERPQPIWDAVVATQPGVFLFIGDNIYGDSDQIPVLRAKWEMLGAQPGYRRLKETCRVLATWDDHDYGINDGGADFPIKRESQQLFLDFFDEPADSPRRRQEGVYAVYEYGPAIQRVQIILLDTRYHRSPLVKPFQPGETGEGIRGVYTPQTDPQLTMLGAEQWKWFEEQLRKPARLRIVATSIQAIPNDHGFEKWGNFPHERDRLFRLIRETQAGGVVLISGDRHLAEMSRLDGIVGYPLWEVTSSSLNQPSGNMTPGGIRWVNEVNRHRVGLTWFETNFGLIEVDWSLDDPLVRLQVRDEKGNVILQQRVTLSALRPGA